MRSDFSKSVSKTTFKCSLKDVSNSSFANPLRFDCSDRISGACLTSSKVHIKLTSQMRCGVLTMATSVKKTKKMAIATQTQKRKTERIHSSGQKENNNDQTACDLCCYGKKERESEIRVEQR